MMTTRGLRRKVPGRECVSLYWRSSVQTPVQHASGFPIQYLAVRCVGERQQLYRSFRKHRPPTRTDWILVGTRVTPTARAHVSSGVLGAASEPRAVLRTSKLWDPGPCRHRFPPPPQPLLLLWLPLLILFLFASLCSGRLPVS